MSEIKTAEEILSSYPFYSDNSIRLWEESEIIAAMEEYKSKPLPLPLPDNGKYYEGSEPVTFDVEEDISGEWKATFQIGAQGFSLQPNGDKKHAEWYVKQLKTAFSNLQPVSQPLPTKEVEEAAEINPAMILSKFIWKNEAPQIFDFRKDGSRELNQQTLLEYLIKFKQYCASQLNKKPVEGSEK